MAKPKIDKRISEIEQLLFGENSIAGSRHERVADDVHELIEKRISGNRLVEAAYAMFSRRGPALKEVEAYKFLNDAEAHDDDLQNEVRTKFEKRFAALQKLLSKEFGDPVKEGAQHRDIPRNTEKFALWKVKGKRKQLFLGMCHEDRELPFELIIGTC